jgi:hypothetical protein
MPRSETTITARSAKRRLSFSIWAGSVVVERALEHLDRDRAAVGGADEPVDDLGRAGLAVARVAELGQRAAAALEVGRGDVVEHERPLAQVAAGERAFDPLLASEQPVERAVELVLVGALDPELGGERRLPKGARHRQLRAGRDRALQDHRQAQRALPRGRAIDQPPELEPSAHREQRLDVARRQRPLDSEALVEADETLAPERRPHQLDHLLRQVRDVADGLVSDLAALAPGAPQQVGDVLAVLALAAVGDDVDGAGGTRFSAHNRNITHRPDR